MKTEYVNKFYYYNDIIRTNNYAFITLIVL